MNGSKIDPKTMTTGNYITGAIVKSLKNLVKLSVSQNPDKNNQYIKKAFGKKLKRALVGKVIQGPKYIMVVNKVTVRRLKKRLRFTVHAQPLWRLVDDQQQVFEKKLTLKPRRFVCWLSYKKKLQTKCFLNRKNRKLVLNVKKVKTNVKICRFKSKEDVLIKKNTAYIDCDDGAIQFSQSFRKKKTLNAGAPVQKIATQAK